MKKIVIILLYFAFIGCSAHKPLIVLTTDFGSKSDAVGICHGVILKENPEVRIENLTNDIVPYSINQANYTLLRSWKYFPKKTVFVTVVDPGVGTSRFPVVVKTKKEIYYIAPNNGLLTFTLQEQLVDKVYKLNEKKINPQWEKGTFDGRDLFSPAAAILVKNNWNMESIGEPISESELVFLKDSISAEILSENKIKGKYILTDEPFGNIWTNIKIKDLEKLNINEGNIIRLKLPTKEIELPYFKAFGDVATGKPLAYINSDGFVAFAINQGNFKIEYQLNEGDEIFVSPKNTK